VQSAAAGKEEGRIDLVAGRRGLVGSVGGQGKGKAGRQVGR
jgi:hypothetical protein